MSKIRDIYTKRKYFDIIIKIEGMRMQLKNVNLTIGLQTIFDDVSVEIKKGEKVGVIGVNGAGKSTFFKLLRQEIMPDSGKVLLDRDTRISFLPQVISDEIPNMEMSVLDFLLTGRPIKELEDKLKDLYEQASRETNEKVVNNIMKKISKVQAQLDYFDVYEAENILLKIVAGMNISSEMLDMALNKLSGGQKSKVAFARLLYSKPEVILLDEPTNHLDNDTKEYIINYLKNYKGTVLVISHDQEFLDRVTNQTLYIDKATHKMELFTGSYTKYLKIKEEREKTKLRIAEKQSKEEDKLKKIIAKYIAGNEKKAKIAKDRQKKLAKLEKEKVVIEKGLKQTHFKIKMKQELNNVPLRVDNLSFGYPNKELLFNNLTFDMSKGEKLLIVGENGVGKSTLLKLIMDILKPIQGKIELGSKVDIGYYAQEHELLDLELSIVDNFKDTNMSENELRNVLGNFLFFGNDVYKLVKVLSPGERSRVALAKLAIGGFNFLVLDEPTNHLDPDTQRIIAQSFKEFAGSMLVVSHNPEFVDNLGIERMIILPKGEIRYYDKNIVMYYQELNKK